MRRRRYRKSRNCRKAAQQIFRSARISLQLKHYARIVAVMMPREKWTDERLDDLNNKVDDGFARVEGEIKRLDGDIKRLDGNIQRVEGEIKRLDENLGGLRREINARFEGADLRFDSLNRNLQATMVAVIVALIGSNAF
jgi:SMC interacting uncharacterized protein involved in chromosome segregation